MQLPAIPVPIADLPEYVGKQKTTSVAEIFKPYRLYENCLRALYAQEPDSKVLEDPYINVLPLFTGNPSRDVKVRARDLAAETPEDQSRYVMALPADRRRPNGSPAVVESIKQFQHNFSVFSESSLAELNWNNVVAAGSSVVNCLLPVPEQFARSKRTLREYYHEMFCPASDVDLFLYGLSEDEAIEKIKEIEASIKDSILAECTTIRTKNTITICSKYPTRHIQIVLRLYKSVSEIVTGFDIDCSGAAYDGKQVYCTPRALQSYMTQINHIDLSRRSPSYENRLSKYSHRDFEVYCPDLDRSRIDPTIFERNLRRTLGLARLLVLERLPTASCRQSYLAQRRAERGRPEIQSNWRGGPRKGNLKDTYEDEVADWVSEDDVSNYSTFTIPYGPKFHAKKIEKLCYTRDLLLNSERNQPKDRQVYLHRHPAFFGRFTDVIDDCCGFCPAPVTEEEVQVFEQESKIYVSGRISFLKDDPGRQQIGSFNPISDDDWTEMAYVGNTARLCQAIVECDAEHVRDWLAQEGADVNQRDYTGRTPLHLAVMSSTPEIVSQLVNGGARLIARLADGRTALHLAAIRGDIDIIRILMNKSEENEAQEMEKPRRHRNRDSATAQEEQRLHDAPEEGDNASINESADLVDRGTLDADPEIQTMATESFVQVRHRGDPSGHTDAVPEETEDDPDVYDVNVLSWDTPCSALHLAIVSGHEDVVKLLCQEYGADALLPVKFSRSDGQPNEALLTLVLALQLPADQAKSMVKTLLSLGATSAQADMHSITCFQRFVDSGSTDLVRLLTELDGTAVRAAINHLAVRKWNMLAGPLQSAVMKCDESLVLHLLESGAAAQIDIKTWLKGARQSRGIDLWSSSDVMEKKFRESTEQPLVLALLTGNPKNALHLLENGVDVNTLTARSHELMDETSYGRGYYKGQSALDIVRKQLKVLRKYDGEKPREAKPLPFSVDEEYFASLKPGTWKHWAAHSGKQVAYEEHAKRVETYQNSLKKIEQLECLQEKKTAIAELVQAFEEAESKLIEKGAKTFAELHPDVPSAPDRRYSFHNYSDVFVKEDGPYRFRPGFTPSDELSPAREAAYMELFEAAWTGDLETIKRLTLGAWDADKTERPLIISVADSRGTGPFALAFARGHLEVASAILDICESQYHPEEAATTRLGVKTYDEFSGSEDSDGEDDEIGVVKQTLDDKFTMDNIGEVPMQAKSRIKPLTVLLEGTHPFGRKPKGAEWIKTQNILSYVIRNDDFEGLLFLIKEVSRLSVQQKDSTSESGGFFSFPDEYFEMALRLGRVRLLAEMIKKTGAGLPLEDMVESTGVKMKQAPKTYQGLTVYGKKRKDWAEAGLEVVASRTAGSKKAPLIIAASGSSIESVEWFLSDTPLRHYLEFAQSEAACKDARLEHLRSTPGGVEEAIIKWMGKRNEFVLHAAIAKPPSEEKDAEKEKRLVEYLIKSCPVSIDTKSRDGYTPLYLACVHGKGELAKLLAPHSDQTIRTKGGKNLVHAILSSFRSREELRPLLDVVDPGLRKKMFKERCNLADSGQTPLHSWIGEVCSKHQRQTSTQSDTVKEILAVFEVLMEYSGGEELEMLDGAGDTPLHTAIARQGPLELIELMVKTNAQLLCRENAVGRTPLDLARDNVIAARTSLAPSRTFDDEFESYMTEVVELEPAQFSEAARARFRRHLLYNNRSLTPLYPQWRNSWFREWADKNEHQLDAYRRLCTAYPAPKSRRLVSLHEANDVARRLGGMFKDERYYRRSLKKKDEEDDRRQSTEPEW